jgi:hypothetical protein
LDVVKETVSYIVDLISQLNDWKLFLNGMHQVPFVTAVQNFFFSESDYNINYAEIINPSSIALLIESEVEVISETIGMEINDILSNFLITAANTVYFVYQFYRLKNRKDFF